MKSEAMRVAVAELCGWTKAEHCGEGVWHLKGRGFGLLRDRPNSVDVPDYPNSLDAIRSAILTLSAVNHPDKDGFDWSERCEYLKQLEAIVFKATGKAECQFELVNATAEQQCEAFLRVKGRFVEEINL